MKSLGHLIEHAPAQTLKIGPIEVTKLWVDTIPVYLALPSGCQVGDPVKLCLFLSGLSGNKETQLQLFAPYILERGYAGVFFDHFGHGERSPLGVTALNATEEAVQALAARIKSAVFSNVYRYGWEILGNGVLDTCRVIDFFESRFPIEEVVMGGYSMGGDTALAAAGIDPRLSRLLCMITTPDWLRPGMHEQTSDRLMDPGIPDARSRWFYDQFDPMTHLGRYARGVDVLFACGELDKHIPPENAQRFIRNLSRVAPEAAARMQIWWNRGAGHAMPRPEDLARLFDWLLLKKPLV